MASLTSAIKAAGGTPAAAPTFVFPAGTFTDKAQFLPDISRFPVTEDIERGISMPPEKLAGAAWVLLGYGLPITVLAYVILRNKEVAP